MKTGFIAHCTIYFVQTSERFTLRVEPVGSSRLDDTGCAFYPITRCRDDTIHLGCISCTCCVSKH